MNARTERDLDAAEWIGSGLLARDPGDETVRRYTARLLQAQGRSAHALDHWTALRDSDANDFEAAFHLAEASVAAGLAPDAAAREAAPAANALFRAAIVDALASPAHALEGEFRHIAISGVAYCGSTLLDRVLGGLPGVKSIGESHWITKVHRDGRYCDMTLSEPLEDAKFVPCTVCGARCEVLTPAFRRSLAADNTNWYRKIAARVGTRILVSADKNLPKLTDKDPLLDLSALVVFKSPEQAWASQLDKLPKDRDESFYEAECRKYVDVWSRAYSAYLNHFRPHGRVVFLNFDAFTRDPEPLLRAVCEALDLGFDADVLSRTVPGHAIGGNGRAMRRLRDKDYGVDITPLPEPVLDPAHSAIIAGHPGAQAAWRRLMDRHASLA
ncbi:hypothetical protein [Sphingomonas sp.]|uniref:hypothetical protein n=1 Tax=Sphingomonas sp. TaxID=28214 RepID=UPI0025F4D336|nr:hypothetical protein [Sphingomonas sp.]MBV9529369.1 hypothetical protein [Sphingomonas sp.]